jgi:hypothetical protein
MMRMMEMRDRYGYGYPRAYNPYVYPKSSNQRPANISNKPLTDKELEAARAYGINDPGFSPAGTREQIRQIQRNEYIDGQMQNSSGTTRRGKITKAPNIPEDKIKSLGDPDLKKGDYVKDKEGNVMVWKGANTIEFTAAGKERAHKALTDTINKLSPTSKAQWVEKAQKYIQESTAKGLNDEKKARLLAMEPDQFINAFTDLTMDVYKSMNDEGNVVKSGKLKDKLDTAKGQGGMKYTDETALFQAMYKAGENMQKENEEFKDFSFERQGAKNEVDGDLEKVAISQVDGWWGDTSRGQFTGVPIKEDVLEKVPDEEIVLEDVKPNIEAPQYEAPPAMPWLQDLLRMGNAAANRASIKKYLPWTAPVALDTADPTFLDDTRAIQRVMGAASTAAQGMGPGSMAQRMALQAQAAGQAADITGQYDNSNVQIANQAAWQNNAIENQEAQINNKKAEKLFDEWTVANQMYDNERRAARTAKVQSLSDTITNMWETDAFNKVFPQYAVNTIVGGQTYYDPSQTVPIDPRTEGPTLDEQAAARVEYLRSIGIPEDNIGKIVEGMYS